MLQVHRPIPNRMHGRSKGALSKAKARAVQLHLLVKYRRSTRLKKFCSCTRVEACTWPDTSKHGARYHHVQKSKEVVLSRRQVFCFCCAVKEWRPQLARVESNLS